MFNKLRKWRLSTPYVKSNIDRSGVSTRARPGGKYGWAWRRKGDGVSWAAHVEYGEEQASDEPFKLDTIQETLPDMPEDALKDLLVDFWKAGHSDHEPAIREVVDYWYRRALSIKTRAKHPDAKPIKSWQDLPERSFS